VGTVRQTLPLAFRVLRSLRPTWELAGVHVIDTAFLRASGVRGLIWDVDGTLTHCRAAEHAPEVCTALAHLLSTDELRHVVLSNCGESRFDQLGEIFPALPIVKGYVCTDGSRVYRVRERGVERWSRAARGVLRPIRKPDPSLVRFAVEVLGIEGGAVAVVGDQYLTDIAAANLAGVRSIKVPTIAPHSFPASVRMLQRVDAWLNRLTVTS
jgi:predicted HAD superfamily phosphohydrolase YqeG